MERAIPHLPHRHPKCIYRSQVPHIHDGYECSYADIGTLHLLVAVLPRRVPKKSGASLCLCPCNAHLKMSRKGAGGVGGAGRGTENLSQQPPDAPLSLTHIPCDGAQEEGWEWLQTFLSLPLLWNSWKVRPGGRSISCWSKGDLNLKEQWWTREKLTGRNLYFLV